MAKLSASALRSAAANARVKSAENAVAVTPQVVTKVPEKIEQKTEPKVEEKPAAEPKKRGRRPASEKVEQAPLIARGMLHSEDGERKTEHVNLLITPSLSRKIETIQKQGGFRSKNAAVIAVLEAFCEASGIE